MLGSVCDWRDAGGWCRDGAYIALFMSEWDSPDTEPVLDELFGDPCLEIWTGKQSDYDQKGA